MLPAIIEKSLLLKNRNPDAKIGPFDGRVGGLIEDGAFFVTSPNQMHIPLPPLGPNRPLKLRADCRYGDDDPIQWPQPFNENFPHYSCIPRQPSRESESVMWWKPTRDAFIPIDSSFLPTIGLGRLAHDKLTEFNACVSALVARVDKYVRETRPERVPVVLAPTLQMVKLSFSRIEAIAMIFRQLEFQICDMQRFWREVVAMLDYMEIYRPRMDGIAQADLQFVADTMGVFTSDVRVAQDHFNAGLPYWLIRPASALNDQNILEIRQLELPYDLNLESHPFRRSVLAEGRAGTSEKFDAIHKYARNYLKFTDPFNLGTTVNINATPAPPVDASRIAGSSSSPGPGLTRTAQEQNIREKMGNRGTQGRGRGKKQRKNTSSPANTHGVSRNKFEPIDSPFMPPPIPSWQSALKAVNTNPSLLEPSNHSNPNNSKYVFPEPGIFTGVRNEVRCARYFTTWNHVKAICLFRAFAASSTAIPLTPQEWRDLLIGNLNGTFNGETNRERQQKIRGIFANCLAELSMDFESFTPIEITPQPLVQSEAQKVLWELSELNFRFELLALDKRASAVNSNEALERQDMVVKCFASGGLIPELRDSTRGLASLTWQERLPFLLRLRALMRDWKGNKPTPLLLPDLDALDLYYEQDAGALEDAVARFYTQSFFNHFGRAAVVPTRLSTS